MPLSLAPRTSDEAGRREVAAHLRRTWDRPVDNPQYRITGILAVLLELPGASEVFPRRRHPWRRQHG
jgi:hypothetical protein